VNGRKCLLAGALVFATGVPLAAGQAKPAPANSGRAKRFPTVADAIEMTQYGDDRYLGGVAARYDVARFSPDGTRFLIVVKRGNIERNQNDYSLLLFHAQDALQTPALTVVATLSSSSNLTAIDHVTWLDNQTIAFLGETPGQAKQLYVADPDKKALTRLTDGATSLAAYAVGPRQEPIVFAKYRAAQSIFNEATKREGVVVTNQPLPDLLVGVTDHQFLLDVISKPTAEGKDRRIELKGEVIFPKLWLSPNGRKLIVLTCPSELSESWVRYEGADLQREMRAPHAKGTLRFIYQYYLIDTASGEYRALIPAPVDDDVANVIWAQDSRSVVVSGAYLPLDVPDAAERHLRQSRTFVAEVSIANGEATPITSLDVNLRRWDQKKGRLLLETTIKDSTVDLEGQIVGYDKAGGAWKEATSASRTELSESSQLEITLEEDMNSPPRFFARDLATGKKALLFDPNPQFKELQFGKVEEIAFKTSNGEETKAGLYRPPNYARGQKYPLVIQTHAWNPERFWIDGPYTTAFASQPLAARGFLVVQLPEDSHRSVPLEVTGEVARYEGAIDYLDGLGLVEREHVGLVGFSRTGLGVEAALTHSQYHFAAATLADTSDAGYFRYLAYLNWAGGATADVEGLNAGLPLADGLAAWLANAPGFSLRRVAAPVRLEAHSPASVLALWEWFAGLSRLGKPVDFVYLPDSAHVLVKPWDRLISQQGDVDWFCFWLRHEEDSDPAKVEQYSRWRQLRELQAGQEKDRPKER
jgi:dipeptidyl aminopeptidase/acylaminoacyl peptidase